MCTPLSHSYESVRSIFSSAELQQIRFRGVVIDDDELSASEAREVRDVFLGQRGGDDGVMRAARIAPCRGPDAEVRLMAIHDAGYRKRSDR